MRHCCHIGRYDFLPRRHFLHRCLDQNQVDHSDTHMDSKSTPASRRALSVVRGKGASKYDVLARRKTLGQLRKQVMKPCWQKGSIVPHEKEAIFATECPCDSSWLVKGVQSSWPEYSLVQTSPSKCECANGDGYNCTVSFVRCWKGLGNQMKIFR